MSATEQAKPMTLLEKAKATHKVSMNIGAVNPEAVDLAIAWLRGEVNSTQASSALKGSEKANNVGSNMGTLLRRACMAGLITITRTNK